MIKKKGRGDHLKMTSFLPNLTRVVTSPGVSFGFFFKARELIFGVQGENVHTKLHAKNELSTSILRPQG